MCYNNLKFIYERKAIMTNDEKILAILEQIQTDITDLKQGQTRFEERQIGFEERLVGFEERQIGFEERLVGFEKIQAEHLAYTKSLHQLINEDFILLQEVDKKVDRLANVTQDHEVTIQKLRAL